MAQGNMKSKKPKVAQKSTASIKKKEQKNLTKGRKNIQAKGKKGIILNQIAETSKAINKKNESYVAAKAVSAGNTFFLNDVKEKGLKEIEKGNKARRQGDKKSNNLSHRLKDQLKKLGSG
jgi:peptidase E